MSPWLPHTLLHLLVMYSLVITADVMRRTTTPANVRGGTIIVDVTQRMTTTTHVRGGTTTVDVTRGMTTTPDVMQRMTTTGSFIGPCGDNKCTCIEPWSEAFCVGNNKPLSLGYIPKLPQWVAVLQLSKFALTSGELEDTSFANVTQITRLSLQANLLTSLTKDMFVELKNLTSLDLTTNPIHSFQSVREALSIPGLLELTLCDNWLQGNPPQDVFAGLDSTVTNITICQNTDLAPTFNLTEFSHVKQLKTLDFSSNRVGKLVASAALPNLQFLRVYNNSLRDLPQSCLPNRSSVFPRLEVMDLQTNLLGQACADYDPCLPRLRKMNLKSNQFSFIICSNTFSKFPSLQELNMERSNVDTIMERAFNNTELKKLSLKYNSLDVLHILQGAFDGCTSLEEVMLDGLKFDPVYIYNDYAWFTATFRGVPLKRLSLYECQITLLENPAFQEFRYLEELTLSGNRIATIPDGAFDSLKNLTKLYLHDNKITRITERTFSPETRARLDQLTVGQNPFICDCDLRWFRGWLLSGSPFNLSEGWNTAIYCDNFDGLRVIDYSVPAQACILSHQASSLIITVCTLLLVILTLAILLSRYRWHFRLLMYEAFRGREPGRRQEYLAQNDFRFDVFVSNSTEDMPWVRRHLMPQLEERHGLRLCLSDRDFIPGRNIVDNIAQCVESSKKILMVFSKHFALSPWCQFELTFCLSHVMDVDDALLIVIVDDVQSRDMTAAMMAVLKTTTYIQWADGVEPEHSFWERLNIALQEVFQREQRV